METARHRRTRTINEDQFNTANRCGARINDSDDGEENMNLLPKPQPTSETTVNTNLFKNVEVTHDKSCQNHSAKSVKAILRVDSDSETHESTSSDENSTDKKELSSKKQSIAKRCKECCSEHATLLQSSIIKAETCIDTNDIQGRNCTISLTNANSLDEHSIVDIPENASSAIQSENNIPLDNNEIETDKKVQPSKSEKITKQFKQLLPYICILLVIVIFGPVCYIISNRNYTIQFVNLNVNFDLRSVETTSGKIPWRPIDANFVALEGNGTTICVLQPGYFSIDVTLNLDTGHNKDLVPVSVCILNSRGSTENRCISEVLPAFMKRSVTANVNLNLQKGDTIWVFVKGLDLVYQRSDVNSMSIIKYDTYGGS